MQRLSSMLKRHHRALLAGVAVLFALLILSPVWLHARSNPVGVAAIDAEASARYRVIRFDWFDASRERDVPARLFWPHGARDGTVPLVLSSHGIGSSDDGYTHLGRYWAAHGIASLHVRHVGSDRSMWEGNPLQVVHRIERAAGEAEALARAGDLRWALDRVLAERYGTRIDTSRIIVAGHSYGANTAMLVAGARVLREGRVLALGDPRVTAAILISAPPFYGVPDFGPILGGIDIPTLHVTTSDDVIRLPGYGSGVDDRKKVFDAMGGDKSLAMFDRGSHNVFTDRRYFDTAEVADGVKTSTQRLTLAFLRSLEDGPVERFASLAAVQEPGLVLRSVAETRPTESRVNTSPMAMPVLATGQAR